jgi:hypothetical protein
MHALIGWPVFKVFSKIRVSADGESLLRFQCQKRPAQPEGVAEHTDTEQRL